MKNLIIALAILPMFAFTGVENLNSIIDAIKKGDASTLSTYFDQKVEIAIMDDEDVYSTDKAKQVLNAFFGKYKPASFKQVHQGTSRGNNGKYCIGNMNAGGKTFRVYIYMNGAKIQELRFDEE